MHVVLFRKKACGKMQQTPVKEVFESVRVEESRAEAEKKTGELEGENCRKDASEASAQHRRDNGVVPLDLETTRNRRRAWRVKVHDMHFYYEGTPRGIGVETAEEAALLVNRAPRDDRHPVHSLGT